jgi:hypothetical protein
VIIVEQRHAERLGTRVENPARGRHVFERTVAAIAEQPARLAAIGFRRAVRLLLAGEAAEDVVLGRPLDVVADEEIEVAVAIEVDPHRRRAERHAAIKAARFGGVREGALAGVPKETVLTDAGDEDVGEAVVVEIADGHAHPIQLDVEASSAGDVGKRPVPVIAIEAQGRALGLMSGPVHAVDEKDVLPAVGVVVDERAAGSQRLGQELPAVGATVVTELKTGRASDLTQLKANGRGTLREEIDRECRERPGHPDSLEELSSPHPSTRLGMTLRL